MLTLNHDEQTGVEIKATSPAANAPTGTAPSLPPGFAAMPGAGAISRLGAAVKSFLPAAFRAKPQSPAPQWGGGHGLDGVAIQLRDIKSPRGSVRQAGVIGLMLDHAGSPEALPTLLGLGNDPSQDVRETVASWLGSFPASPEALAALVGHAKDDSNWGIRRSAATSLAAFLPANEALAALVKLSRDEQPYVREAANAALAQPKHPEFFGLDSLTTALMNTKSPDALTRQNGVMGLMLKHHDSPEALATLLNLGHDSSQDVQGTVVAWLGSFPASPEALTALVGHATDANGGTRLSAATSLAAFLPAPDAKVALIKLAGDEQQHVRKAARAALNGRPL